MVSFDLPPSPQVCAHPCLQELLGTAHSPFVPPISTPSLSSSHPGLLPFSTIPAFFCSNALATSESSEFLFIFQNPAQMSPPLGWMLVPLAGITSVCPSSIDPTKLASGSAWEERGATYASRLTSRGNELPHWPPGGQPGREKHHLALVMFRGRLGAPTPGRPGGSDSFAEPSPPAPSTHVQIHTDAHSRAGGHRAPSSWAAGLPLPPGHR